MEFFDWLNFPQIILRYIPWTVSSAEEYVAAFRLNLIICLGVAAGLYLVGQIMGGIGLYTIGKRAGHKNPWIGFVPFLNTWYAGKIAGETNFFGQKMKRAGLYATLIEVLYVALEVFVLVLNFLRLNPAYFTEEIDPYYGFTGYTTRRELMGANQWMYDAMTYCDIAGYLLWFLMIIFFCVLYTSFFRKYYARGPILLTFLCVLLPFRGFTIFAVRNNAPVDYNEYLRKRAEEYARRNAPYNGGYGAGQSNQPNNAPDPFSDFGGSAPSDPPPAGGSDGSDGQDDNPFSDF